VRRGAMLLCVCTVWWWKLDYKFAGQRREEKSGRPKPRGNARHGAPHAGKTKRCTCKVGARR
jgi:hypothetical protein